MPDDTWMPVNTCIACGAIIPEGGHICPSCENRREVRRETNRDKLLHTAEYDTLCKMNSRLHEYSSWRPCIMTALGLDFFDRAERCRKHDKRCEGCIAAWLNEDVRHG